MEGKVYYITKEKLQELKKEYQQLAAFERSKIVGDESPKMLESEDMSMEFVSFQEDINSLRLKMDEIEAVLANHELIKNPPKEARNVVHLGAKVKIEVGGKEDEVTILGTLEANPSLQHISNESPVGKALLGRKVGEEITISSPHQAVYKIKKIRYETN